VSSRDVLGVFKPGEHGSTFGGNPLACAVGTAVVRLLPTGEYQSRASELGGLFGQLLSDLPSDQVAAVRTRGLWGGIDLTNRSGREVCEGLLARRVLAKDAHGRTIRLAPPLVISENDLRWGVERLADELAAAERGFGVNASHSLSQRQN
jgi:ornithine--oxo-acid transaminase